MTITLDGTNGISAANVFGRNLIINGSGRVNQRAYVSGTATTGANQYTLDRWRVVVSSENLTFTGNDSRRVMTAPAGGVEQVVEGLNVVGGDYVLNWDGTATATVNGVARTKGEVFTLPANTNATIRLTGGTFTDVQLEKGTITTPFEVRSYAQEELLCHRYCWQISAAGAAGTLGIGPATATNQAFIETFFPVRMRAAPTASILLTLQITNSRTFNFDVTGIAASYNERHAARLQFNFSGSAVVGEVVTLTTGIIRFDAEL